MSSQESARGNHAPPVYEETEAVLKRMDVTEMKKEELKEAKGKNVMGNHDLEEEPSTFMEETAEEEDILQPYYHQLSPPLIEALRLFKTVCAHNTYLTREVILLEKHIIACQDWFFQDINFPVNGPCAHQPQDYY